MTWQLRTAAIQLRATGDLTANLATCRALLDRAAAEGARLAVLPECFAFLGRGESEPRDEPGGLPRGADKLAIAEDLAAGGPILGMLREAAAARGLWVIAGGTPERIADDPRRAYNTAIAIDPAGEIAARYRKIHLFDVDIPGGATLRESDATAPGDAVVTVDVDGARVGLSICYDLRFPELYRALVRDHGAEVIVVPAAFTAHTGAAHWHVLLRARAIENQAWVVAAAQWGRHNEKRESYGHTLIVDPWGAIVEERAEGDGVVIATLDGDTVARRRAQMPCLQHARL